MGLPSCVCTVIALTEKQALKYGITPDDQLPEVAEEMGWSTSPMTYGDLSGLVDQKIPDSDMDKAFLLKQKEVIKAEWTAKVSWPVYLLQWMSRAVIYLKPLLRQFYL